MHRDSLPTVRLSFLCLSLTGLLLATPLLAAPDPSTATGAPPSAVTAAVTAAPPAAVTAAPPVVVAPPPAVVLPPVVAPERPKREEPMFDTSTWPVWAENAWVGTSDVLHDHLRIGFRYRHVESTDGERSQENSYLGSITELKELDDYDPITYFTFEWLVNPYAAVRFNMEQLRSQTVTSTTDRHTDGDVDLSGPALMLIGRLPNPTRITPSAGIGYAWLTSTFEHNPEWFNGFDLAADASGESTAYRDWIAAGSPPWPNHGYRREIILDDTSALIIMGALEFRITDHLDFNLYVQDMEVQEVDVLFTLSHYGQVFESTHAKFPMSNIGYGAGLRWTF